MQDEINLQRVRSKMSNENLIAYCGLYFGDCFNHKGEIADLARNLRKN